ncbi:MAG: class I SAM-dependent methyltransferase [Desulfovibrio sp.]
MSIMLSALSLRLALPNPKIVKSLSKEQQTVRKQILNKIKHGEYILEDTTCFCGFSDSHMLSPRDKHQLPFPLVICIKCGTVRLGKRLDASSLAAFYDEEYRPLYNPGFRDNHDKYHASIQNAPSSLAPLLDVIPPTVKKTLDVGCHFGGLVYHLKKAGYEASGIDFDSKSTRFAREKMDLDCRTGGIDIFTETNEQFDLVSYMHVFEHVNDLDTELQKVRKIIRSGGYLYLDVPGLINWIEKKQNNILNTIQSAHSWYFTLNALAYVVERNGFELITGNEAVQGLFRKLPNSSTPKVTPDDCNKTLQKLKKLEQKLLLKKLSRFLPASLIKE